jgi:hypothetical protein
MQTRDEIVTLLKEGLIEVTFTKTNGEERVMKCSLHKDFTSSLTEEVKETNERKINEDVIPAWDIENVGWRSFRIDSITSIRELGKIPDVPIKRQGRYIKKK